MSLENPTAILTNAAGNQIGSISDGTNYRLTVNTLPAAGVVVAQDCWGSGSLATEFATPLTNSGSNSLLVSGSSSAPIVFSFPAAAIRQTVYRITFVMSVPTLYFTGNRFGGVSTALVTSLTSPALTNGILIGGTISGTNYVMSRLNVNEDFLGLSGQVGCFAPSSGTGIEASVVLNQVLAAGSADKITVTVQDNISNCGATYFRATAFGIAG